MDRILWYSWMIFIHRGLTQDIANCFRAVRAMNETLKQNRLLQERGEDRPFTRSSNDNTSDLPKNVHFSDFYKWGLKFIYLFIFAFLMFSINLECCDGMHVLLRIIGHGAIAEVFTWLLHVNYVWVFAKFHENVVGSVYPYELHI